jgi:WD40 repeat protein
LSGSEDKTLKLWNINTQTELFSFNNLDKVLALDHNSNNIVATGGDGSFNIRLFNTTSRALFKTLSGHTAKISALKWLNDEILISCSEDFTVKMGNISMGSVINSKVYKANSKCYSLEVINESVLAAGYQDFSVVFLNITNFDIIKILTGHSALSGVLFALTNCINRFNLF